MIRSIMLAIGACTIAAGAASAQTPAERGAYLVTTILACGNCHTPAGPNGPMMDKALSGNPHQVFDTPGFKVVPPNITEDKETGIGAWTDAEIRTAMRTGVRPNGVQLAPIMPYPFYSALSTRDLNGIVAYLRTVKPVNNTVPPPDYKAAIDPRPFPGAEKPIEEAQQRTPVEHGHYLATIGHCMECHTPLVRGRWDVPNATGKGGRTFEGPWGVSTSRNITSSKDKGIGAWTDDEIKRAITQGIARDGTRLKPPMAYASYARMTPGDLDAIVAWLRTVPAKD
jgi:mono/diheme cytochrome c family protein